MCDVAVTSPQSIAAVTAVIKMALFRKAANKATAADPIVLPQAAALNNKLFQHSSFLVGIISWEYTWKSNLGHTQGSCDPTIGNTAAERPRLQLILGWM